MIGDAHLILFVADQRASGAFYRAVLGIEPRLDVPGMCEFQLGPGRVLGLMPQTGARRLLGDALGDPADCVGVRSELYLYVDDAARYLQRALAHGARSLSALAPRDWGDLAGYVLDPDGHLLAFAEPPAR